MKRWLLACVCALMCAAPTAAQNTPKPETDPFAAVLFGLLKVIVRSDTPPMSMVAGLNSLWSVGVTSAGCHRTA